MFSSPQPLNLAFGCDHAGFQLQQFLINFSEGQNFNVINCGTMNQNSVDYPDFAKLVIDKIQLQQADRGILICGTGMGMCITANRLSSIRAACCYDKEQTIIARQHNNINVLCLGARLTDDQTALECFKAFLETDFEGGRHQKRLDKIDAMKEDLSCLKAV